MRIRFGNLSMWNHPIHMHGPRFWVTGGDGGRLPPSKWRAEVTEIVGVGQTRDIEFDAIAGDWALHCHMSHHTMNAMGHDIPNPTGVDQAEVASKMSTILPGYMAMGQHGMAEHQSHVDMGHMPGPENTLPMMMGKGPHGNLEMGGMFTVIKVRDGLRPGDYCGPGLVSRAARHGGAQGQQRSRFRCAGARARSRLEPPRGPPQQSEQSTQRRTETRDRNGSFRPYHSDTQIGAVP